MYTIPKNEDMVSSTRDEIIKSELFEENLKPIEVRAGYSIDRNQLPVGQLCLTKKGIIFLTDGSKKSSGSFNWATYAGAAAGGIVGGLVGMAISSAMKGKQDITTLAKHPSSLFVSYNEIIKIFHTVEKEMLRKRGFLHLDVCGENGTIQKIYISPIDKDYVDLVAIARFGYEKDQYVSNVFKAIGYTEYLNNLVEIMQSKHGKNWRSKNLNEFNLKAQNHCKELMEKNGFSEKQMEDEIKSKLTHFRSVNHLVDYFK
jgi:hypothetical protein